MRLLYRLLKRAGISSWHHGRAHSFYTDNGYLSLRINDPDARYDPDPVRWYGNVGRLYVRWYKPEKRRPKPPPAQPIDHPSDPD